MTSDIGQDFYAFDASIYPLIRKGYKSALFFTGNDQNIMQSLSPPGTYGFSLENQMLPVLSTQGVWMYYQFSGDTAILNASVDYFTRILQGWNLDADGLPEDKSNWWTDGTSAPQDTRVFQAALYYSGLQATKQMIGVVGGHATNLSWLATRMTSIEQNFNRVFWNGSEYRSPGYTKDTDERGAAWAVITGLADASKYGQLLTTLTGHFHASVFSEQWCEQALYLMGHPDEAMTRMKTQYAAMINSPISTLWENFPPAGTTSWNASNGTMNHGWAGGSLQMLNRYGAGIYPLTVGSATMAIQPALGSLSSLSTTVSTLKGELSVAYTQTATTFTASLTEPPGMTSVQLSLPTKDSSDVSVNGTAMLQGGTVTNPVSGVTYVGLGGVGNGSYVFTVTPGAWNFGVNTTTTAPPPPDAPPPGTTPPGAGSGGASNGGNATCGAACPADPARGGVRSADDGCLVPSACGTGGDRQAAAKTAPSANPSGCGCSVPRPGRERTGLISMLLACGLAFRRRREQRKTF